MLLGRAIACRDLPSELARHNPVCPAQFHMNSPERMFRDTPEPHWAWLVACVLVPIGLLMLTLAGGMDVGAPVSLGVAAAAPRLGCRRCTESPRSLS